MIKKGSLLIIALIVIVAMIIYIVSYHTQLLSIHIPSLLIGIHEARTRRFGLILDVRTQKERDEFGYYPNSIPLSMNRLTEITSLTSNLAISILVYSNGAESAYYAAQKLYAMGYHNVKYISTSYLYLMPGM